MHPVKKIAIIAFLLFLVSSCETTEKFLKTADTETKYLKALEWYHKGAYFKAIPVFEELMGLYKGSKTTEDLYYYYCMAQYKQKNYILSSFHFKNFVSQHPRSKHAEECLFMYAESYEKQSPKFNLDQSETLNAIDAYQIYINQYPKSDKLEYCNDKIDELREKLEHKSLRSADLYFKTQNYRAAAFSYRNLLIDYPDIDNPEDIQFKVVKSFYKYAEQSIVTKQQERYEEAIKVANSFISRYPNSERMSLIEDTKQNAHFDAIKSAFHAANISKIDDRADELKEVFDVFKVHALSLKDNKLKTQAFEIKENTQFELIRTYFIQAQNAKGLNKKQYYIDAMQAYVEYVNKYKEAKHKKEALRIYQASQKNLNKLNKNG